MTNLFSTAIYGSPPFILQSQYDSLILFNSWENFPCHPIIAFTHHWLGRLQVSLLPLKYKHYGTQEVICFLQTHNSLLPQSEAPKPTFGMCKQDHPIQQSSLNCFADGVTNWQGWIIPVQNPQVFSSRSSSSVSFTSLRSSSHHQTSADTTFTDIPYILTRNKIRHQSPLSVHLKHKTVWGLIIFHNIE